MTNDKSPGAIRSGLFCHFSSVICHFESGAGQETLELRVLSVKWSKVPLQRVSRCRTPPSRTGLFTAAPSGLAGLDKNFREETATAIAGKQTTEAVSGT